MIAGSSSDPARGPSVSVPYLETRRLLLRELRAGDFPAFAANSADSVAMQHFASGIVDRRIAWRQFLAAAGTWLVHGVGWWALELRETHEVVGQVGAFRRELSPDGELELGWVVFRAFWGRGLASEAARGAMAYAFDVQKADRAIAQIAPSNEPSIRVAERIGMRFERDVDFGGLLYRQYFVDNNAAARG
jgi:RimJ/RimL family protein N-acetyltransferase